MANETTPNQTIDQIKDEVGTDPKLAYRAYKQERAGKQRATLLSHLKEVVVDSMSLPGWVRKGATSNKGARFQMAKSNYERFADTDAYAEVADLFADADDAGTRVRLDTDDSNTLGLISAALWNAADEVYESITDFKTFARASRIAAMQATVADTFVEQREAAEAEAAAQPDEEVDGDADQDAADIVNETVDA